MGKKKGKKGGKAKGGKGGKKKVEWVQQQPPDGPMLPYLPRADYSVEVKGVAWRLFDFALQLSSLTTVGELSELMRSRQGGLHPSRADFLLYKEEVAHANLLNNPTKRLCELEYATARRDDDVRIFRYDYRADAFYQPAASAVQERDARAAAFADESVGLRANPRAGAGARPRPASAAVVSRPSDGMAPPSMLARPATPF